MTEPETPTATLPSEFEAAVTAAINLDRLWVLEICYYIAGIVTALGISVLLIHFSFLLMLGLNPHFFDGPSNANGHPNNPPPPGLFLGLAGLLAFIILLGWIFGALQIYAGRCIKKRCHRVLILIIAGLECLFIPWGTFIGVCTFLVMERPSVKALFDK